MGKRSVGGEWFSTRQKVFDRDDNECLNCETTSNLCVHHIVPLSEGGNKKMSNLVTLCRECHRRAHGERLHKVQDSSIDSNKSVLSVEEISRLCRSSPHPLHQAVLTTLAKTGIGVGELCNLNINDIDVEYLSNRQWNRFEGPFLRVRYGGKIPYNNRRERITTTFVPIDEELSQVLKRWLLIRPNTQDSEPLFCSVSEWGKRLSPSMTRSILE